MSSKTALNGDILDDKHMLAIRFSITLFSIMAMGYLIFICLAITFHEEKQKRFEFLVKNKIIFESKLVQDILAMLVPKFIKSKMVQSIYFNIFTS